MLPLWLKMAIIWPCFSLLGHYFGCCDHSYAHFRHRSHQKTPDTCGKVVWGLFCPLWLPIGGWRGPKYGYFWGKNPAFMAGGFQGENHTWKWFNETYHTPMHGISLFKAILALSRHLSRVTGVQRWLFLWLKQDQNGRPTPG